MSETTISVDRSVVTTEVLSDIEEMLFHDLDVAQGELSDADRSVVVESTRTRVRSLTSQMEAIGHIRSRIEDAPDGVSTVSVDDGEVSLTDLKELERIVFLELDSANGSVADATDMAERERAEEAVETFEERLEAVTEVREALEEAIEGSIEATASAAQKITA